MKNAFAALRRSILFLIGAALACSALAADTVVTNDRVRQSAQKSADPALWVLSDADTTIYLFGTMHMMKPGTLWFDDEVKAAFDKSDLLVMEITDKDPATVAPIIARLALYDGDTPITKALDPDHRAKYLAALEKYRISAAVMDKFEPWMAAINLSVAPLAALGYREDLGVEKTLTAAAQAEGKPMLGLETVEEQLGYFDALPRDAQIAYLNSTIDELPKVEHEFDQLTRNWATGNAKALAGQLNESLEETPELAKVLLFDRNARWTGWIEKRMAEPGTVFIAVGAGHLSGKGSVIDLLHQRKFKVRRVSRKDFRLH